MKLTKIFLPLLAFVFLSPFTTIAQTSKDIHKQAHQNLLANKKSVLDKSVINEQIKNEIIGREEAAISGMAGLSPENAAMINDLLEEAKSHYGKKYVWATHGPNTFDCSGFTGYVYKQFGYNIGFGSKNQYLLGTPVDRNKLRPGDLVFFTSPRSGSAVGHVGIVVTVDHENSTFTFIHASVKKGISYQKFEGYYKQRYMGAKRIIND